MLNEVVLMGRLTRDPETRYIQGGDSSATRFTLAVDRDYKAAGEDRPKTDFISCTAWNKTGEFISRNFRQGNMIAVTGSIETGSYTNKDGVKVCTTEVKVNKASFTGEKTNSNTEANNTEASNLESAPDGFMNIPDGLEGEGLPFN